MRILILGYAQSIHIKRLVDFLKRKGHQVAVASLQRTPKTDFPLSARPPIPGKLAYFFTLSSLRYIIKEFKPDLIHAHNVTSYGILGARSDFHPLMISVWGLDITDVCKRNPIVREMVRWALHKADLIAATSLFLQEATHPLCPSKEIFVTPFGIETDRFIPQPKNKSLFTVGTVRHLLPGYGIDILIRAYSCLRSSLPETPMRLIVVGDGFLRNKFINLAQKLQVSDSVEFMGYIPNEVLPRVYNEMDIFVLPSMHQEAYGVAALEAASCGLPIVASKIGGIPEIVTEEKTGFLFPPGDYFALAKYLRLLYLDKDLRQKMGAAGREVVVKKYDLMKTGHYFEELYLKLIGRSL